MSRITAPVAKLARAMGTSTGPVAAVRPLRDMSAHNAGAALMPKYADLLRSARSNSEHHDSSRGMTTTHRPTPQPSLANRPKPLMQTFHSSAPSASAATANLDAAVLPSMADLFGSSNSDFGPRMPLLPDNYSVAHGPAPGDGPVHVPSIVAADPDKVLPAAPLSALEGISMDGVELKFVHENQHHGDSSSTESAGMIRDLWKGMIEDVLGPAKKS